MYVDMAVVWQCFLTVTNHGTGLAKKDISKWSFYVDLYRWMLQCTLDSKFYVSPRQTGSIYTVGRQRQASSQQIILYCSVCI